MKRVFIILIIGSIIACQNNEQVFPNQEFIYSMTSIEKESKLQDFISSLTLNSRSFGNRFNLNKGRVFKIEKPLLNEEIYSIPSNSDPTMTMVLGIRNEKRFGFTITLRPNEESASKRMLDNFSGDILFHTLNGNLWRKASLINGENTSYERGRSAACYESIDVFYTLADLDGDGVLDVTHIEFGDPTYSCDPMDTSGIPPTPDDDSEGQPGGSGYAAGIIGLCPMGFIDLGNGCVEECQQGEEHNEHGDCVERTEPCNDDPLIKMRISTYNLGVSSNRYGCVRVGSGCNNMKKHGGIDLMAPEGTPIFSLSDGTVVLSQENHADFGNWIIIKNGDLFYTYAHLENKPNFNVGDTVSKLDILGNVGDTGNAPDNEFHLHLEIKQQSFDGQSYNASTYKDPEEYLGTNFDSNGNAIKNNDC